MALTRRAGHAQGTQRAITVSLSLEPPTLDPTMSASASIGDDGAPHVLKGLTKIEEDSIASPLLTKAWARSPDGTWRWIATLENSKLIPGRAFT